MSATIVEAILSEDAAVTAIVTDRIFYSVAPQGAARPYLVLIQTTERDAAMLAGQARYPEALVNVVAYADSFPVAYTLGNSVIAALQDAVGTWRGKSATLRRDDVDSFDFLPTDRVHRRILGFICRYR